MGRLLRQSLSTPPRRLSCRRVAPPRRSSPGPRGLQRVLGRPGPDGRAQLVHIDEGRELGVSKDGALLPAGPLPPVELGDGPDPAELVVPAAVQAQLVAQLGDGGDGDGEAVGGELLVQLLVRLGAGGAVGPVGADLVLELVRDLGADADDLRVPLLEALVDGPRGHLAAVLGEEDLLDARPWRLVPIELDDQVFVLFELDTGASSCHVGFFGEYVPTRAYMNK